MKKIITVAALVFALYAQGQQTQETITYSMKVENSPIAAMMGNMQITVYCKNGKSLTDMASSVYSMKTLATDTGTLTLMEAMGQKIYFKNPPITTGEPGPNAPVIKYTTETKQIAGYTCTKALVLINKGGVSTDTAVFWYTDKLPVVLFGKEAALFKGLKGMPLEYEINLPQVKMSVVAQTVSTAPIADSVFMLSTNGYTQMDAGDLTQLMQQ